MRMEVGGHYDFMLWILHSGTNRYNSTVSHHFEIKENICYFTFGTAYIVVIFINVLCPTPMTYKRQGYFGPTFIG
jgi:hypothetical protein